MFLLNTWYVAASSAEVQNKPLGRKICGQRIVFFRNTKNEVSALEDFCPHRGAPLSLGFQREDHLVCGYHGLAVDCKGHAAHMTGQNTAQFPKVKKFPAVERYGFIWVWPGNAEKADESLIPVMHWYDNPEWAYGGGMYHINCNYLLMIDNLMDLTHETYVHATSIGQSEIEEVPVKTTFDSHTVCTSRHMQNVIAPPFWQGALKAQGLPADELVDRWQVCKFSLPTHVMIDVGVAVAGKGGYEAAQKDKAASTVVDFISPEDENSMWYFWGMARQFRANDPEVTAQIKKGQGGIFSEDLEMLERQQSNLVHWPERRLMKLNIDAGGVHSRRIIEREIALEQAAEAAKS
jgi:vanillate O-demethylase monooxygenase subunit